MTNGMDISFNPGVDSNVLLEDALGLLETVSNGQDRLIAVFDEFQEVLELEKGIDKKLRAIMQEQTHVNYVFLGSQESMMTGIFEKVKSPFYHFGQLMHLKKIPLADFKRYVQEGLSAVSDNAENLAEEILGITNCHPYYTQQLAATVWDLLNYIWTAFSKNERRILRDLATLGKLSSKDGYATSTTYTTASRMLKAGYLIKTDTYEIEDPFFKNWLLTRLS